MTISTFNKTQKVSKLSRFVAKYSANANLRRAEKELNKFSDRQLEDMGISRGDVHGKVWGEF
ncbi:MAG: DUF1127 domain-containing protein [Hyphomicrobiales bacterium]